MELLRGVVSEKAGKIAAFPARGVELEKAGEEIIERFGGRCFDANVAGAFELSAVVAKLFLKVGRSEGFERRERQDGAGFLIFDIFGKAIRQRDGQHRR